jgi:hypothetical protein
MIGPCPCGDTACPSCGAAQGTLAIEECPACGRLIEDHTPEEAAACIESERRLAEEEARGFAEALAEDERVLRDAGDPITAYYRDKQGSHGQPPPVPR